MASAKKVGIGVGVTLLALFILGAIISPSRMERNATATAAALLSGSGPAAQGVQIGTQGTATIPPAPSATIGPTKTPPPTKTPAPTGTPRPTSTPRPTATPTIAPTPTLPPEPITLSGSGQDVTAPVFVPFPLARVTLAHDGQRNFIVYSYVGDDQTLLANAIGRYSGSRLISGDKETLFEVNADGGWVIHIAPLGWAPELVNGAEGQGDTITDLFDPPASGATPYEFTHTGERNFIVQLICAGGADYVQNEIGAVDGAAVVRFSDGPCLWDVQADGAWTIKPRE